MSYGEVQGGMGSMASYNALEGADFTGDLEGEDHGRAIFLDTHLWPEDGRKASVIFWNGVPIFSAVCFSLKGERVGGSIGRMTSQPSIKNFIWALLNVAQPQE